MFEKINCAYELLTSNLASTSLDPDIQRIVICLQAQSIVYSRHAGGLAVTVCLFFKFDNER